MMQVARAAFQAVASLNQQATDPKSHTLVRTFYTRFSSVRYLLIPMVDALPSKSWIRHGLIKKKLNGIESIVLTTDGT
jgi:hypothetical protein